MKKIVMKARDLAVLYLKWGWPALLAAAALDYWAGEPTTFWRGALNNAAFAWILCAPVLPISLLLDRPLRERAMAKLCGLREGDERERAITGEAARATLLLALSLQTVLLAMSLITFHFLWNPLAKSPNEHGLVTVGLSFSSSRHLDPFGATRNGHEVPPFEAPFGPTSTTVELGGFLLSPSAFSILAVIILVQLVAFKAFSVHRYEGTES